MHRYAIKRLANKLSKVKFMLLIVWLSEYLCSIIQGLVKCCLTHASSSKRLGLFSQMCGIHVESDEEDGQGEHKSLSPTATVHFDRRRFDLFLHILELLFQNNSTTLRLAMNGDKQDIWRETALSALPAMFPQLFRGDYELFCFIRFEISSMEVTSVEHNAEYTLPLMKVRLCVMFDTLFKVKCCS